MNAWFRFYNEAVFDPKVQQLSPKLFKIWINLLCLASRFDGVIPSNSEISFTLRMTEPKVMAAIGQLSQVGLIDKTDNGLMPHNWDKRQFKSDGSTDRVKRFRERFRNVSETLPTPFLKQDQTQTQIQTRPETEKTGKDGGPGEGNPISLQEPTQPRTRSRIPDSGWEDLNPETRMKEFQEHVAQIAKMKSFP